MGKFSNGTEGMLYEEKYCNHCIHGINSTKGCNVWMVHLLWNRDKEKQEVLDVLIERDEYGNGECSMFIKKQDTQENLYE